MITERLRDGQHWFRVAERAWDDPLDPSFARLRGGRWNPPGSWRTLYLNEDLMTARLNVAGFAAQWPYEPEDLRGDTGPDLAVATLPRRQDVADAHTPEGLDGLGLPTTYPVDTEGELVGHRACQAIGVAVHNAGLRGVHCRSAHAAAGAGRELAWFPATTRSRATLVRRRPFRDWYWA